MLAWARAGIVVDSNFRLYLIHPDGHVTRIGPSTNSGLAVGGSRVAFGAAGCETCTSGPVVVIDMRTKQRWQLGAPGQLNQDPSLSPNGRLVAWGATAGIWVSAVSGGTPRLIAPGGDCPRWSPNGRSIAYLSHADSLDLVPAAGGASRTLVPRALTGCDIPGAPTWSPNSTQIAFQHSRRLAIVDVRNNHVVEDSPKLGSIGSFAWTNNNSGLYALVRPRSQESVGSDCNALWLLRLATLHGKQLINGCG